MRTTGLWVTAMALGVFLLTACIPKGAKNWPFSIGPQTNSVALRDLDNDGDLDAFLANGENEVPVPDTVWLNDGSGHFQDSGQRIAEYESHSVILADMDADGNLDAITGSTTGIVIFFNGGPADFRVHTGLSTQRDLAAYILAPAVGDVNGDGWLDVLAGSCCGYEEQWGGRRRVHPPQDALWIRDGDLDAIVGNFKADELWINLGGRQGGTQGEFTLAGHLGKDSRTRALSLADVDGDGDQDLLAVGKDQAVIWTNDGLAGFAAGQEFSFKPQHALAMGDVNGDGAVDVFAGSVNHGILIWLNDGEAGFRKGP
jgi:hypothetical protein